MGVILETNQLCKFYGTGENQVIRQHEIHSVGQPGEHIKEPHAYVPVLTLGAAFDLEPHFCVSHFPPPFLPHSCKNRLSLLPA